MGETLLYHSSVYLRKKKEEKKKKGKTDVSSRQKTEE
jgi:hypothetical protein